MLFPLPVGLFPRFFEKMRIELVFFPLFVARNRRLPDLERLALGPVQPIHLLNWIEMVSATELKGLFGIRGKMICLKKIICLIMERI